MFNKSKNSFCMTGLLVAVALMMAGCSTHTTSLRSPTQSKTGKVLTLVTGITGNQGGGVANTLLEKGYPVRGMTRNPDSERAQYWANRGAEIVYGDFTDRPSMNEALVGTDYIYINLQEQVPDYVNASKYLFDAANAAGVKHMVYSSSRPSDPDYVGGGHKTEVEKYLRASGYSYSTLRIPFQMSSPIRKRDLEKMLHQGWQGRGKEDKKFAWISPDDLGYLMVAAIEDTEGWNGKEVNLSGDEITDLEAFEIMKELSGLDLKYIPAPEVDERWSAMQNFSYDTEELRAQFPMTTFREYLIENNFRETVRALAAEMTTTQAE